MSASRRPSLAMFSSSTIRSGSPLGCLPPIPLYHRCHLAFVDGVVLRESLHRVACTSTCPQHVDRDVGAYENGPSERPLWIEFDDAIFFRGLAPWIEARSQAPRIA